MKHEKLTVDDPRLTALAAGEITDSVLARALTEEIEADPALRMAFAEICAVQQSLRGVFAEEIERERQAISPVTVMRTGDKGKNVRSQRGGGMVAFRREESVGEKRQRLISWAVFGSSVAAVLTVAFLTQGEKGVEGSTPQVAQQSDTHSGETRIFLPPGLGFKSHGVTHLAANGGLTVSRSGDSGAGSGLGQIVAQLPRTSPAHRENAFSLVKNAPVASLSLESPGVPYAVQLQASLAAGRLPERSLLRIDGMVNALLNVQPEAALAGVSLEVEAVPAPWAEGHWLVRATVNVKNPERETGATVAEQARGEISFAPEQVASWRLLGCEDGGEARSLAVPASLRVGERVTTLFELVPAEGARTAADLGKVRLVVQSPEGTAHTLERNVLFPHPGGLTKASEETRMAAAIASFGLAVRDSAHKGTASLSQAQTLASATTHRNQAQLQTWIREAAPLVRE